MEDLEEKAFAADIQGRDAPNEHNAPTTQEDTQGRKKPSGEDYSSPEYVLLSFNISGSQSIGTKNDIKILRVISSSSASNR